MKTLLQQMQDVDKSDENSACVSSYDMFKQFALQDYSISYDKFDSRFKNTGLNTGYALTHTLVTVLSTLTAN